MKTIGLHDVQRQHVTALPRGLLLFVLFLGLGHGAILRAQDIHFSQYYQAPMALGPGNIGAFEGDQRVHGIFRQQWRSVTTPYRTFGLGGDARHVAGLEKLAVGGWLFNDRAGDSRLNQFHLGLGASWTERPGNGPHAITLGFQAGFTSLSLDQAGLTFDSQYNGFQYDPSLGSGETFDRQALVHGDLHAGLLYRYVPAPRRKFEAGLNLFNLTRPSIGFLFSPPVPLDMRGSLHATGQFPVAASLDLLPMARYMVQGPFTEVTVGANVRHILLERYGLLRAVQLGLHVRAADAGFVHAGLEYDDWTFGISYDLNTSDLVPASRHRGAIEFTAVRIFRRRPAVPVRFKACPDQI
jgi:type IX secretion system PorP/SprF family membrane protein